MMNQIHAGLAEGYRYYRSSEAQDYYPYEYNRQQRTAVPRASSKKKARPSQKRKSKLWIAVMVYALAAALCGALIVSRAEQLSKITAENSALSAEIKELSMQLDEKKNAYQNAVRFEDVNKIAIEKLGMRNPVKGQLVAIERSQQIRTEPDRQQPIEVTEIVEGEADESAGSQTDSASNRSLPAPGEQVEEVEIGAE